MGIGEFLVIVGVVLVLFKPAELPTLLVTLGKILRKIRQFTITITDYLESTVQQEEAKNYAKQARQRLKEKDGFKKKRTR